MKSWYVFFFCLAMTLHNLEEALWLPKWSQLGSPFQKPVASNEFHFAVIIITALAYVVAFLYVRYPKINICKRAFTGLLGAMIFNAVFPHLIATIVMKTYAPGLATAFLLNIPINSFILYKLHKLNELTMKEILISTCVIGILLIATIPILFALGGTIFDY